MLFLAGGDLALQVPFERYEKWTDFATILHFSSVVFLIMMLWQRRPIKSGRFYNNVINKYYRPFQTFTRGYSSRFTLYEFKSAKQGDINLQEIYSDKKARMHRESKQPEPNRHSYSMRASVDPRGTEHLAVAVITPSSSRRSAYSAAKGSPNVGTIG